MMRYLYPLLATAGLVMVLIPTLLFYFGNIANDQMRTYVMIGTVLWFAGAIPWLGKKKKET